jgi:CBS domain-containing protein
MSRPALPTFTAGALCTRIVNVVDRAATLSTAARQMRDAHVGCLVVVDRADQRETVAGVLTDRDIVVAAIARDLDPRTLSVEDVMTRDAVTVQESASMLDALASMRQHGLRRLPVLGPHGVLVGLLSLDDLLAALAMQVQAMTQAIIVERQHEAFERS